MWFRGLVAALIYVSLFSMMVWSFLMAADKSMLATIRTGTFSEWKEGNQNSRFFDIRTIDHRDPCRQLSPYEFVEALNLECIGDRCCNQSWTGAGCYRAGRIIADSPAFPESHCNKNIAGNYIMVWEDWDIQLNSMYYQSRVAEKREVYGDLVNSAQRFMSECNGCTPRTESAINIVAFLYVMGGLSAFLMVGFLYIMATTCK